MRNPYALPAMPCSINVSGGRSSAFMLRRLLDAHGGRLPQGKRAVFANTGREDPRTLDFVAELSARWSVPITWLEFDIDHAAKGVKGQPKLIHRVVNHNSASRMGEPFRKLVDHLNMIPTIGRRLCTKHLKIITIRNFMARECGYRKWHSVIGLRADETRRAIRVMEAPCDKEPGGLPPILPMFEAGDRKEDIMRFWAEQDFDLATPPEFNNCDLCYLKPLRTKALALRHRPEIGQWWADVERKSIETGRLRDVRLAQFRKDHSIGDIIEAARQDELPGLADDEPQPSCHCTD